MKDAGVREGNSRREGKEIEEKNIRETGLRRGGCGRSKTEKLGEGKEYREMDAWRKGHKETMGEGSGGRESEKQERKGK